MHMRIVIAFALVAFTTPVWSASLDPLRATVTANGVEVRNVTPQGEVILMTASVEGTGGLMRQTTGATRVPDEDGDGVVTLSPPRPIPLSSIWVAVERPRL